MMDKYKKKYYGFGDFIKEKGFTTALTGPVGLAVDHFSDGKFSDWMNGNAGIIGTGAGAVAGLAIGNPMLGAKVGGALGNAVQGATEQDEAYDQAETQVNQLNMDQLAQNRLANPSANGQMQFKSGGLISSYKTGGNMYIKSELHKGSKEEMEHTKSNSTAKSIAKDHLREDPNYYTKLKKAGLADSYANGGDIQDLTMNKPNVTMYANGGSHESNPNGGVPLGDTGNYVEEGEVRYGDYVFTNRF